MESPKSAWKTINNDARPGANRPPGRKAVEDRTPPRSIPLLVVGGRRHGGQKWLPGWILSR
jgi:hypothetical protein